MTISNRSTPELAVPLLLLMLLAGCAHIDTASLRSDEPGDFNALLEDRRYERAGRLLDEYPYLDTPGQRERLHARIADYEQATIAEADAHEADGQVYRALEVVDAALVNLPHSTVLNDHRRLLDDRRERQLRDNQRKQLVSRARYIVEQQSIYAEQLTLGPAGLGSRLNHTLHKQESNALADKLFAGGNEAVQDGDLETAGECLRLSQAIDDTPAVRAAIADLDAMLASQRDSREQQEKIQQKQAEKQRALSRRNRTKALLVKTRKALDANDLLAARSSFGRIPAAEHDSRPVIDMQERLRRAIEPVVVELLERGDRQYRADKVDRAIHSWSLALELDPENSAVQERLERARRVMARLEELKNRQP